MFRDVLECSGMFWNVPECSMFRVLSTPYIYYKITIGYTNRLCGLPVIQWAQNNSLHISIIIDPQNVGTPLNRGKVVMADIGSRFKRLELLSSVDLSLIRLVAHYFTIYSHKLDTSNVT